MIISEPIRKKKITQPRSELETIQMFRAVFSLLGCKRCHLQRNCFELKMAEKPNEEGNSQSSQLDEEDLQKFVGDGGNNCL